MEDDLGSADGVVHALVAAELPLDDLDVEVGKVRARTGRVIVEHAHAVAPREQGAHEVRSDEPCSAGDQDRLAHFTARTW